MRLDKTIIPWTYSWLYYFEDWLSTGEWRGGGIHPGDGLDELRTWIEKHAQKYALEYLNYLYERGKYLKDLDERRKFLE